MLTVRQGRHLKKILNRRGYVSATEAWNLQMNTVQSMPASKQALYAIASPDAILDYVLNKMQSPENRNWSLVNNQQVRYEKLRGLDGGVLDNIEQCMDDHDPIDLTEWDDDLIQEWDVVRIPHEELPGRFWCFKKDTLATWRQINPDKNPRTNAVWTPAQRAIIDANVPIVIADEDLPVEVEEEVDPEVLQFTQEFGTKPIDKFKVQVPKNDSLQEVANPTTAIMIRKDGRIENWSSLPIWLKRKLTDPQVYGKYRVRVDDMCKIKVYSTNAVGQIETWDYRGSVPEVLFQNIPEQESFGEYLTFGLLPVAGPKRILNWAASGLPNFSIWVGLYDGLDW